MILQSLENQPLLEIPGESESVSPAGGEYDKAIDEYLFGKTPEDLVRRYMIDGPEVEADDSLAELYSLYFQIKSERDPAVILGMDDDSETIEPSRAYYQRLKLLDDLPDKALAKVLACRQQELRLKLDAAFTRFDALLNVQVGALVPALEITPSIIPSGPTDQDGDQVRLISGESDPQADEKVAKAESSAALEPSDLAEVEPLLQQGKWLEVVKLLDKRESDPKKLPPGLALLYAISLKESADYLNSEQRSISPDSLGINAVGRLFSVPITSTAAMLVAKRALRLRQLEWTKKPSPYISLLITFIALALGAAVGFLINPDLVRLYW
jgi:hypothetical protein